MENDLSLQSRQDWFRLIFDSTSDLMAMHSVADDGRLLFEYMNRSLHEFHSAARPGVDSTTWLGRDLSEVLANELEFPGARIEEVLAPYRMAIRTGLGQPVSHVAGSGASARHREGVITPLKDKDGCVTHLFYRGADITERLRAEGELRRSAERFEKLFHTSPVPTLVTRLSDGRILEMNEAYLRTNGYTRERLLDGTSRSLGMWVDPAERDRFRAEIAAGSAIRERRMQFRNGTGEVRDYLYSAERIDWHGELAVVSFPVDITVLEAARREALASSERFEKVFELSPVPIVIGSVEDGRYFTANEAWLSLHGYSREEIEGQSSLSLGVADTADRERVVDMLARRGEVRMVQARFRKKTGEYFDSLYAATFIDWKGERAIVGIPYDVTELERARREAQASSERFAKVFDLSPTPIVVGAIADGRYLAVNEAWLELHGYERGDLEGHGSLSLGVWADPADRARIVELVSQGAEVRRMPVRFRRKSGEIVETLYSAIAADWKGERAVIATPQDVTELNRAAEEIKVLNETLEARVRQRTAALEQANRELEAFTYSVSHDLRAPLRALSSFGALLAARPGIRDDPEASGHAGRVVAAASRMGTIVDALLNFSRLSRKEIAMHQVDLAAEVEAIIAELTESAAGRELEWKVGALPVVQGDPTLLRLVLQNLLDNAVKYTARRPDPVIEILATFDGAHTTICVKDNGVGFDMQYADKVFGVFERLHADGEFEGTGIGLANAQRIVHRHGGRIWCEAAPGRGASFCFSLPASPKS